MITYECAKNCLEQLEEACFEELPKDTIPALSNGLCQFFSIENATPTSPTNLPFPLIVTVGINYDQGGLEEPQALKPHIYTRSGERTRVEDYQCPETRKALKAALKLFCKERSKWHDHGYASKYAISDPCFGVRTELRAAGINPPTLQQLWASGGSTGFIMICTNVSPFLSRTGWSEYSKDKEGRAQQLEALGLWDPNKHIRALYDKLSSEIDLWVIHGKEDVWRTFKPDGCIRKWIKTPNLSIRQLNRGQIGEFWTKPDDSPKRPKPPVWPNWVADITALNNFVE